MSLPRDNRKAAEHNRDLGKDGNRRDSSRGTGAAVRADAAGGASTAVPVAAHAVPSAAARYRQLHGPSRPDIPRPWGGAAEQELAALADAQLEPHAGAQGEEGTPVEAESTATPNLRAHSLHATEPANCGVPLPLMTQHQRQSDQR